MTIRIVLSVLALLSVFLFPWPVALLVLLPGSYLVPPLALAGGLLYDFLYYVPGPGAFPFASVLGALAAVVAFLVQRFVKARIMGG